jgi:tetratricopeptide (TPR) repeat protein
MAMHRPAVFLAAAALATAACSTRAMPARNATATALIGTAAVAATNRDDLSRQIQRLEARLAKEPGNAVAAVALADALLRETRVTGNAGLAKQAEATLNAALVADPLNYSARRMLATVYLSQHRFRDAIRQAEHCRSARNDDPYVYGVLGDGHLELGDYDEAFAAFDRMMALRPNAAAYARASYARELQGDLQGALKLMAMAADATSPQDAESLAWHHAQLGHLNLELGRLADARREYAQADFVFPGHPFAIDGLARIAAASGNYEEAIRLVQSQLAAAPTPAGAAYAGDLLRALGRPEEAEREYRLAEAAWITDTPEPSRLAKFLAEHHRRIPDAVRIAEAAAADRHDIFTMDALAWAYFQDGQLDKAMAASKAARHTGSRDRDIVAHAAAIDRAAARVSR